MKPLAMILAMTLAATTANAQHDAASETAVVAGGVYRPLFPATPAEKEIAVHAFRMDRTPVTNAEFLVFVGAHPAWRRDRIPPVFAEPTYLAHWSAPDALGQAAPNQPVVNVSWFAARAYCGARGMRLPTEAEWELAASGQTREEIAALYAGPMVLRDVGQSRPNRAGLYDMHGLVWEWVSDFGNAVLAFGSGSDRLRFCGATGASASDATDFAAFQRVAFRSSLRASYVVRSLGFRCAGDV
ncbi:MAG TPA: formylglycine-generating enzyme family protein [Polyangiaceae bacterium]|jgi:formylglycine-generating enzyme required for sulfatase activity